MSNSRRDSVRLLASFLVVTAGVVAIGMAMALWFGAPRTVVFSGQIWFWLLLSGSITASAIALTAAAGRVVGKYPLLVRWAVYLPTFAVAGATGTLLASVIAYVLGIVPRERIAVIFSENIQGTIPTTIIVGVFVMSREMWKARVQATEAALRAQHVERERAERLASEAQLAALSSRVQPHFLFNTLNAIAALVRDNPRQAEQMVEQLSSVLRTSLDAAMTVPIEREMKLVDDYLRIQEARLGRRLRFDIAWAAETMSGATVPPFAVQTLVENAIKHVAGRRADGVSIQVKAARAADAVVVEVRDDGAGFEPDAVKAGHGLDNLQGRLRTLYGERAGLEFDRRDGAMTVRLRVPIATA
jgi:sensor histidine kinase YesM